MSLIKKKLLIIAIILILLLGVIAFLMNAVQPTEMLTFNRTIQEITYEDTTAYITCANDTTNYIFYNFEDVTVDCLKHLTPGDEVTLMVKHDYQEPTYAIIYKLSAGNRVIFDSTAYYEQHDQNIATVFASLGIALLLSALGIILLKKPIPSQERCEFKIKFPEWGKHLFIICMTGGIGGFAPFWILYWLGRMEYKTVVVSYAFLLFVVIGILGIYVYANEWFSFSNGVYQYSVPFCKKRQAAIREIGFVEIQNKKNGFSITFFDKDENKLFGFRDSGMYMRNGELIKSLTYYKISRKIDVPPMNIRHTKPMLQQQLEDYGRSMLYIWFRGEKYTVRYDTHYCELSKDEQDESQTLRFASFEELCASLAICGIVWANVERLVLFA